ncbi:kinase-like domain-containing protein [Chytriomyces sp. MP71]|nr:kinase-like domain-containing protein [Chytriomyces sp. MP71]
MDAFKGLLSSAQQRMQPLAASLADQSKNLAMHAREGIEGVVSEYNLNPSASNTSSTQQLASTHIEQPPGTFLPGTPISVNNAPVIVDRYLAQAGGFAHVYLVSNSAGNRAVLKRTLCPDETLLRMMKSEVEFMRLLNGHSNIVQFFDASVNRVGSGYEVYILMEYCGGGTLIDYLNARLEVRLTEPEILEMFHHILLAVHHMHFGTASSPILHRDLKIENILISSDGKFKVCDFGSATSRTFPRGVSIPTSEIRGLEDEVDKVTTLQYRAPELCDLYMRQGVNEKVDVWALGVLLYKLCYYTTPFEGKGKLAILNGRFDIPSHPRYSFDMTDLIAKLLTVDPSARPSVHDAYERTCQLLKIQVQLSKPPSQGETPVPAPSAKPEPSPSRLPTQQAVSQQFPSNIAPMRRGRPTRDGGSNPTSAHTSQDLFLGIVTPATPAASATQNDPWVIKNTVGASATEAAASLALRKPAPPPPRSLKFDQFKSSPALGVSFRTSVQSPAQPIVAAPQSVQSEVEDEDPLMSEDEDDDETGGLTRGGKNGADKYAAFLKESRGRDSDGEDAVGMEDSRVVSRRKSALEGMLGIFKGKAASGPNPGLATKLNEEIDKGGDGFSVLPDKDAVDDGARWANEVAFNQLSLQQPTPESVGGVDLSALAAAKKKPPAPPVPAKSPQVMQQVIAASSLWTIDAATAFTPAIAESSLAGSFWAGHEAVAKTESISLATENTTGWANEVAFETAFPAVSGPSVVSGWADENAFEATASIDRLSSSSATGGTTWATDVALSPLSETARPSSSMSEITESMQHHAPVSSVRGGIANNAFMLADKIKKPAPQPPPSRKSSDNSLRQSASSFIRAGSEVRSAGRLSSSEAPIIPPSKPARRKPLPDTTGDGNNDPFIILAKK